MYAQFNEEAKDFELENANMIQIKKDRASNIFNRKIMQDKQRLATLIGNERSAQLINMTKARISKTEAMMRDRLIKLERNENVEPDANIVALGIVKIEP